MASENRTPVDRLELFKRLQAKPFSFSFYQALRLIEAAHPDKPRIGHALRAADDVIRLAQEPAMTFAPATLASFNPSHSPAPQLTVRFAGLFGPNGPLPLHLTEYARDRQRNEGDPTLVRFADIFHHRILSLFYRAWSSAQPTTQLDRPEQDRFAAYVGSLIGLGMPSLRNRDALPDNAKLHFAGRLVCHTRNAEGLEAMLNEFCRAPMEVREFVGQWVTLPEDCRCYLGKSPEICTLGQTATIGERIWDCQQKFRIVAGPLSFDEYCRLLPGGNSLKRVGALVNNYVGLELDWDLSLVLRHSEVPQTQLGSQGRLGWTTWLSSRPPANDASDLCLRASRHCV